MNEKDIKGLKWEKDKRISLGNNLYLNSRRSSKTFIVRNQQSANSQIITLGKHPALSLSPTFICGLPVEAGLIAC